MGLDKAAGQGVSQRVSRHGQQLQSHVAGAGWQTAELHPAYRGGEGPLALLKLRNFSLPLQIFTVSEPAADPLTDDTDPTEETY